MHNKDSTYVADQKNGQSYIYRPWITRPDGSRIYAKQYGKKAFRIPVDSDKQ